MKKILKRLFLITMIVVGLGSTERAMAAQTLTNPVKIGSFVYFDMNNDGLNEKIGIFPNMTGGILEGYSIRVNDSQVLDVKISTKKQCSGIDALTIDTKSTDDFTDLYISQFNESGYFDGNVYRYDGNSLKKIYNLANVMKLSVNAVPSHEQPGNGKIRFAVPGYPIGKNTKLGEYEVYMDFKISNGKLTCSDTTFKTTESYQTKSCLEAYRSFKVYKDKNQQTKAYTIKAGEKFYVTKIVSSKSKITHLQIKNKDGKTGWIVAPTKKWIK